MKISFSILTLSLSYSAINSIENRCTWKSVLLPCLVWFRNFCFTGLQVAAVFN